MTAIFFNLFSEIGHRSSRNAGRMAFDRVFSLLETHDVIEIDLANVILTPSIADEVIGVLAQKLGKAEFKKRVKIKNASPTDMSLLKHVIARRLFEAGR